MKEKVMRQSILLALALALLVGVAMRRPAQTASASSVADQLAALLPSPDLVTVIDVNRAMSDLVPRLRASGAGNLGRTVAEIESFAQQAGVDLSKASAAVAGLQLKGLGEISGGTIILDGLEIDLKKVESAARAGGGEVKAIEVKGKTIHTVTMPRKATTSGQTPARQAVFHFTLLGPQRVAFGDLANLQALLGTSNKAPEIYLAALRETKSEGLVRFAGHLPADLRTMLAGQGDLFQQLAEVKVIFGTLDLTAEQSASLDARLRTSSSAEAATLETGLRSLIFLGKSFLGGETDPKKKDLGQLLDQVRISAQNSDVGLALVVPKSFLDQWLKPADRP
jgi:hypothetical protein